MAVENRFGTSAEMIIEKLTLEDGEKVVAIDTKGLYITSPEMVGRNLADVNRYGVNRSAFISVLEELGYDPSKMYEDNKHLIDLAQDTAKKGKKLNPIKASKRR